MVIWLPVTLTWLSVLKNDGWEGKKSQLLHVNWVVAIFWPKSKLFTLGD
jgi:hypothetical protein